MTKTREQVEDEISSLELLAWMAIDADNAPRAKRFRARARTLRASIAPTGGLINDER